MSDYIPIRERQLFINSACYQYGIVPQQGYTKLDAFLRLAEKVEDDPDIDIVKIVRIKTIKSFRDRYLKNYEIWITFNDNPDILITEGIEIKKIYDHIQYNGRLPWRLERY